jgi:hypothetical protein
MKALIAALIAAFCLAVLPSAALASSVIDQYIEQVPKADGPKPSAGIGNGPGSAGPGPGSSAQGSTGLGSGPAGGLAAEGDRGARAAAILALTDPDSGDGDSAGGGRGAGVALEQATAEPGIDQTIASMLSLDRGGTGLVLPAVMLGSLLVAGILARRRSKGGGAELGG